MGDDWGQLQLPTTVPGRSPSGEGTMGDTGPGEDGAEWAPEARLCGFESEALPPAQGSWWRAGQVGRTGS